MDILERRQRFESHRNIISPVVAKTATAGDFSAPSRHPHLTARRSLPETDLRMSAVPLLVSCSSDDPKCLIRGREATLGRRIGIECRRPAQDVDASDTGVNGGQPLA
jgi:hypothetical protein